VPTKKATIHTLGKKSRRTTATQKKRNPQRRREKQGVEDKDQGTNQEKKKNQRKTKHLKKRKRGEKRGVSIVKERRPSPRRKEKKHLAPKVRKERTTDELVRNKTGWVGEDVRNQEEAKQEETQ